MASSSTPLQAEAFPDGTTEYVPIRGKKYDVRKPREYRPAIPSLLDLREPQLTSDLPRYRRSANDAEELATAHQLAKHYLDHLRPP